MKIGLVVILGVTIALLSSTINCDPSNDEIFHLPGWKGPLPSRWFAGFMDAGSDM